jgi:phosphoglycerol transferase MdoB-like AlkP superfamily enzyme
MIERLRRYDVQASYALTLAILSIFPFLLAAYLALSRYDSVLSRIIYGSRGKFVPVFAACVLLSLAAAGLAFLLGWNSAGQRRNDKSGRSWMGFFLGGLVATLDVVLLAAFVMLRLEKP